MGSEKVFMNIEQLLENLPNCSSILSHSSSTKCLTFFRLRDLSRARARIRPGVPTTMWGQSVFNLVRGDSEEIA